MLEAERPRLEQAGFAVGFAGRRGRHGVLADEDALRQVLGNLLSNAEKYSAERREIGVEARRRGRPAVLPGARPGHRHRARARAAEIFREFYRVDDSLTARVKGTGLGLSIARRIVRDHGGELSYEPREGGGSAFRAEFPAPGDARAPAATAAGEGRGMNEKILVVDDEEAILPRGRRPARLGGLPRVHRPRRHARRSSASPRTAPTSCCWTS